MGHEEKPTLVPSSTTVTSTATPTTTTSAATTAAHFLPEGHHLSSAFFAGSQSISWDSPADVVDYMETTFRFKPKTPLGLLFFWRDGPRHVVIYLRKGYVLVEVNMGSDTVLLRSVVFRP